MIAVVDYGIGNLFSASKALAKVHSDVRLVATPDALEDASAVVVPGVGDFGACMTAFRTTGFADAVSALVGEGRPLLGVCVGMQMLFEGSDEAPNCDGLGIFEGVVQRMVDTPRLPHMQWNQLSIRPVPDSPLGAAMLDAVSPDPWVYFVHSYAVGRSDHTLATATYGAPFAAMVGSGSVVGTQFHPEKSST
ncbi:MAG: imidazole glycerol phosphate synthase subunit HisH, partial [Acidimicrobiales bacterium]